jgi:hypothetical protein
VPDPGGGDRPTPYSGALATLAAVAHALEAAGARFLVGGSLASSLQGIPRSTLDVDLVADLGTGQVAVFVAARGPSIYADAERIRDGVARRASFNVVDLTNGYKADVYLTAEDPFDRSQFARRQFVEVEGGLILPFASPEDVVLQKLRWFRLGGGVSERQWLDALGVLKVQGNRLDREYLQRWAAKLELERLLARAEEEAGSGPGPAGQASSGAPE